MVSDKVPLTLLEQAFVNELLADNDPRLAAIRAGYEPATIAETLKELYFEPHIIAAIERAKAQRDSRVKMTQDTVLHEMSLLSHSSIEHYVVSDDGSVTLAPGAPVGAMRAVQSVKRKIKSTHDAKTDQTTTIVEVEIKLWDKPSPLRLMGRQIGLFKDKVEHSGPDGGPIPITEIRSVVVDPKPEARE